MVWSWKTASLARQFMILLSAWTIKQIKLYIKEGYRLSSRLIGYTIGWAGAYFICVMFLLPVYLPRLCWILLLSLYTKFLSYNLYLYSPTLAATTLRLSLYPQISRLNLTSISIENLIISHAIMIVTYYHSVNSDCVSLQGLQLL